MADSKKERKSPSEAVPKKRERETAAEHPPERQDYTAGADGEQNVDTGPGTRDEARGATRDRTKGTGW
jgi:hypothetical protein